MAGLKKKFGKKLKEIRNAKRVTQEELADKTGLTVESISNIERGIFGPQFDNLEKIAEVLGVEVKTLFDF